jgi:alpha-glucosidase
MRLLIDFVPNHTSDRHPWFQESRRDRSNRRRDWYVWRDPAPDGGPPNNWRSEFPGVGSAWTLDPATGQYYLHTFLPSQPELNWDLPAVRDEMQDVLRFWLARGVDGVRVDVIHKIGKDPLLRDDPAPEAPAGTPRSIAYHEDWPTAHERVRGLRKVIDEFPDRLLVGEVYLYDQAKMSAYVQTGDELHLAHDFTFLTHRWGAEAFRKLVQTAEHHLAPPAQPAWCLNNHDHSRAATRYGHDGLGQQRARLAALLLLTLRGTPFLFQGEELGLEDATVARSAAVDVAGRDPARAPIPWVAVSDDDPFAGFSTSAPWLPLPPDVDRANVARQRDDDESMLAFYQRLLQLRRVRCEWRRGTHRTIETPPGLFAYVRSSDGHSTLVVANLASDARSVRVPAAASCQVVAATHARARYLDADVIELAAFEGMAVDVSDISPDLSLPSDPIESEETSR